MATARHRLAPWLAFGLALVLVAFVFSRIDLHAFRAALARVSAPGLAVGAVAFVFALLTADSAATTAVFRRAQIPVTYRELFVARGASYVASLINHHVGQALLVLHISRTHGTSLARVAGATLVVYASWIACLLAMASVTLASMPIPSVSALLPLAILAGYALLIAAKPAFVARRAVLAPLFEAGLAGHAHAIALRLPHFAVVFAGTWLPLAIFGVRIPIERALALIPILMVVTTLPITPNGLGTRDVVAATLFVDFAPGATREERLATIAASTTSWVVAVTIVEAIVGLAFLRRFAGRTARSVHP